VLVFTSCSTNSPAVVNPIVQNWINYGVSTYSDVFVIWSKLWMLNESFKHRTFT
jgi:hypothetical protein